MKKMLSLLVTLVLVSCCAIPFFALGEGEHNSNQEPFTFSEQSLLLNDDYWLRDSLLVSDTLYLLTNQGLFAYTINSPQLPALIADLRDISPLDVSRLFFYQNNLYGFSLAEGLYYQFDFITGSILPEPALTLRYDFPDENLPLTFQGVYGNELFITATDHGSLTSSYYTPPQHYLYSFDLSTGGSLTAYQTPLIRGLFPGHDGEIFAWVQDANFDGIRYLFGLFSSEKDSFTPWENFESVFFETPAYDAANQTLYYISENQLYSRKKAENSNALCYIAREGSEKAFVTGDNCLYILQTENNELLFTSTSPKDKSAASLLIHSNVQPSIIEAFTNAHPSISVSSVFPAESITAKALLTQTISLDVLAEDVSYLSFGPIKEKAFAYPLNQSPIISEKVNQMYPYLQKALTFNEEIYAIPGAFRMQLEGYRPKIFEAVGLSEENTPSTYLEYLQLMLHWQNNLAQKYPDVSFSTMHINRYGILLELIDAYTQAASVEDQQIIFDTPLFRDMVSLVDQIDFDLPHWSSLDSQETLFSPYVLPGSIAEGDLQPLPLSIEPYGPPYIMHLNLQFVFINPHTQNFQSAITLLETIIDSYPTDQLPFIFPHETTPVQSNDYINQYNNTLEQIKVLEEKLTTAEEKDKAIIEETIILQQNSLEVIQASRWLLSAEDISFFQDFAQSFVLPMEQYVTSAVMEDSVTSLIRQYESGDITLDEFITQADQKMEMSYLERQ